jgi:hypothetical protein
MLSPLFDDLTMAIELLQVEGDWYLPGEFLYLCLGVRVLWSPALPLHFPGYPPGEGGEPDLEFNDQGVEVWR